MITTTSSFGAILIASIAIATSQSPFLDPSGKIWRSFVLRSYPYVLSVSRNFSSIPSVVVMPYAIARMSLRSETAAASTFL